MSNKSIEEFISSSKAWSNLTKLNEKFAYDPDDKIIWCYHPEYNINAPLGVAMFKGSPGYPESDEYECGNCNRSVPKDFVFLLKSAQIKL